MSEKRRGLGRGLGALIPSGAPATRPPAGDRPVDVFFPDREGEASAARDAAAEAAEVSPPAEETSPSDAPVDPETQDSDVDAEIEALLDGSSAGEATTTATDDGTPETAAGASEGADEDTATSDVAPEDGAADTAPDTGSTPDDGLVAVPGVSFAELPIDSISPNPRQPRQVFDEEELAELVHSIREIGVLQPIVVRPSAVVDGEQRYELIMGERRWRATRESGLATIPAIIRATADDDLLRDALLENLHRSQLNPLEEAAAYAQLLEDFGCTHDELATRIGRSRPQISNTIRLLRLPPLVQRRLAAGVLSAGHARALLGVDDVEAMERLAQRVVAEGLSVRAVEEIVALGDATTKPRQNRPRAGTHTSELNELASRLGDRFDTRVQIALGRSKGKLSIEFASVDDLNRIVALLAPEERGAFKPGEQA